MLIESQATLRLEKLYEDIWCTFGEERERRRALSSRSASIILDPVPSTADVTQ